MIHLKKTAILLWIGVALCAGANATVESLMTPAGHRFLYSEMEDTDRVAFQVAWPSSWFRESGRNPAVPYVGVALMTSGGAGDMDPSELLERFRDLDAVARLWATPDHVRAVLNVSNDHLDEALEIARDVLVHPRFDERSLARIRDRMYRRLKQSHVQVGNRGWMAVRRAVLGVQPIAAASPVSDVEEIRKVTRDGLLAWHRRTIVAEGARVVVAGNLARHDAVRAVGRVFAGLPLGESKPMIPVSADFSPRTILVHVPDAEKSMIGFVGSLPARAQGGEYEDAIAIQVLGGGAGSRLFRSIRSNLRASYAPGAGQGSYTRDIRFLSMWGEVDIDKLARAGETFLATYRQFREQGPTATEIEDIKARLLAATRANLRKPGVVAHVILESVLDGTDARRVDNLERELEATTAGTIRERLRRAYPLPEDLIQVIVTPNRNAVDGACVVSTTSEVDECLVAD